MYQALLVSTSLISLTLAAPITTCELQYDCLDVLKETKDDGMVEICLIFHPKDECQKSATDSISHVCPTDVESDKIDGFASFQAMCKEVPCGTDAHFGIKDGSGCSKSNGLFDVSISGVDGIYCSATPYCGGGGEKECKWSIPAGSCPTPGPTALANVITPAPITPAPVTPAPVTPAPVTPAPVTPAPVTPAPVTPAPVTPAPVTPAPVTPAPTTSAPTTPAPTTPAPTTAAPTTPAPTTSAPTTPAPTTPAPTTSAPTTPAPTTCTSACSMQYEPVCGADGTTYNNFCYSGCNGVAIAYEGPCTPQPTTAQPTLAPTYTKCATDDALNIGFLLDESASVDLDEWGIVKNFVERIITFDISTVSSVKMWKYATYSYFQEIQDWTVNDESGGHDTLVSSIQNTGYSKLGLTMTWDAMNRVLDDYWQYRFECTDGCETRSDLLFLITDGLPTGEAVCPDMTDRMSQSDVDVVIIIVDPDNVLTDTSAIDCLDVGNNKQDVIRLPEFDSDAFTAIELRIREKTCSGNNPAGPGERPAEGSEWVYEDGSVGMDPVPEHDRTGGAGGEGDASGAHISFGNEDTFKLQHHAGDGIDEFTQQEFEYNFDKMEVMTLTALFNAMVFLAMLAFVYLIYLCYNKFIIRKGNQYKVVDFQAEFEETDV